MEIINKINKNLGGKTKEGLLNNIFEYYEYEKISMKKIPPRFMNAYTKNYIKETYRIKYENNELINIYDRKEIGHNEIKLYFHI